LPSRDGEKKTEKSAEAIVSSEDHYRRAELKLKERTLNCATGRSRSKQGWEAQISKKKYRTESGS
jgi:hypothetical protein